MWRKFPDAVYYIELGQGATPEDFGAHLKKILRIESASNDDLCNNFTQEFSTAATRENAIVSVVNILAKYRFLLLIDDVWQSTSATYAVIRTFGTEMQTCRGGKMKLLLSSRDRALSRLSFRPIAIELKPRGWNHKTSRSILYHHARLLGLCCLL